MIRLIMPITFLFVIVNLMAQPRYDSIQTKSGREYKNFIVLSVDPSSIKIENEDGVAKIKFQDLPDSWLEKYNFDPALAEEHERKIIDDAKRKYINDQINKKINNQAIKIRGVVLQKLRGGILAIDMRVVKKKRVVKTAVKTDDGIAFPGRVTETNYTDMEDVEEDFGNKIAFIESGSSELDKLYEGSDFTFEKAWQVEQYEYINKKGDIQIVPKLCITRDEARRYFERRQ